MSEAAEKKTIEIRPESDIEERILELFAEAKKRKAEKEQ